MADIVYALCAITSVVCAVLLFRAYRRRGVRLLLWAAICFTFLALQNVLVFVDIIVLPPSIDLSALRGFFGVLGAGALLYGLINDDA